MTQENNGSSLELRRNMDSQLLSLIKVYHEDLRILRQDMTNGLAEIRNLVEQLNSKFVSVERGIELAKQSLENEIRPKLTRHDLILCGNPEQAGMPNTGLVGQVASLQKDMSHFKSVFVTIWSVVVVCVNAAVSFVIKSVMK